MALANPLAVADFYDLFSVQDVGFVQGWMQQRSATGGGETRYADRAPSLWKAEITTIPMLNAAAEGIMALVNSRAGGLKTVLLYNSRLPYPSSDSDGSILAGGSSQAASLILDFINDEAYAIAPAAGQKILTITDRLHIAMSGFPVGYVLPLGTYFGAVFDTSRYYLGQVVERRTANGAGVIPTVEVWPPLPASVAVGTAIILAKPPAKFRIVPGSAYPAKEGGLYATIKFTAEQTYSR